MLSRLMTRREQALLLGVAAAIVLGCVTLYVQRYYPQTVVEAPARPESKAKKPAAPAREHPPVPEAPKPVPSVSPPPAAPKMPPAPVKETPREMRVGVTGAVRAPGTYTLKQGSRVGDVIQAGGGLTEDAETSGINLAAALIDGTTLYVPQKKTLEQDGSTLRARGPAPGAALNPPEYLQTR